MHAAAHFVEDRARRVAHLVKLIDAADAAVAQHERSALKHKLARFGVLSS
jgi:hypothetical protein